MTFYENEPAKYTLADYSKSSLHCILGGGHFFFVFRDATASGRSFRGHLGEFPSGYRDSDKQKAARNMGTPATLSLFFCVLCLGISSCPSLHCAFFRSISFLRSILPSLWRLASDKEPIWMSTVAQAKYFCVVYRQHLVRVISSRFHRKKLADSFSFL